MQVWKALPDPATQSCPHKPTTHSLKNVDKHTVNTLSFYSAMNRLINLIKLESINVVIIISNRLDVMEIIRFYWYIQTEEQLEKVEKYVDEQLAAKKEEVGDLIRYLQEKIDEFYETHDDITDRVT